MNRVLPLRRAVLLPASLLLAGGLSGCMGCSAGPGDEEGGGAHAPGVAAAAAPPAGPLAAPAGEALRVRFPEQARRILDAGERLVAASDGFAIERVVAGHGGLAARFPAQGEGQVRFEAPGGASVGVREVGAAGAGAVEAGAVAYAREGGTSYWAATARGYEEWIHLTAATAGATVASWEIEGATPRAVGEAVELDDAAGVPRVRVMAPSAYAIGGTAVGVHLAVNGARIELSVDADGEVLVDPSWAYTGSMTYARNYAVSATLASGNVLVAGGSAAGVTGLTTAEVYSPSLGTWALTGTMTAAQFKSAAVTLGNGNVLVVGGVGPLSTAELYSPSTNGWSNTTAMTYTRSGPSATLLADGRVLVVGGLGASLMNTNAEVYNAGSWSTSAFPAGMVGRRFHVAVRLSTGNVLVAGGVTDNDVVLSDAWLFNPTTFAWTQTGSMATARSGAAAVLLSSGSVLITGGSLSTAGNIGTDPVATTEIYGANGVWTAGPSMAVAHQTHTATLLQSGSVLVAGGSSDYDTLTEEGTIQADTELYSPSANSFSPAGSLGTARIYHTANLLSTGAVLVAGGALDLEFSTSTAYAELFTPGAPNGSACGSASACTSGFCANGVCCNTACNAGVCNACSVAAGAAVNGTCALLSGIACNDANACTQTDVCENGVCTGTNPVVCPAPAACYLPGVCNPASGACSYQVAKNGTACEDGNLCTTNDTCQGGVCGGGTAVTCVALDTCHTAGVCNPMTGCNNPPLPDGTACNDANACTQIDICEGAVCTGTDPVVCPAPSPTNTCQLQGTCNPGTGLCSTPVAANGTACSDGNACTTNETCVNGACQGGGPVTCVALDSCHSAGTCNTVTGCSNPALPDGTACNDGNACTQTDVCKAGVCTGTNPVVCAPATQCQQSPGTCDTGTGLCNYFVKVDGTACNDGNACTTSDACKSGVCTGTAVSCAPADQCNAASVCDLATGACLSAPLANGTPCNDGNGCTQLDTCQNGVCVGGAPLVCTVGPCQSSNACDPSSGMCVGTVLVDGTACSGGDVCTTGETCLAGACVGGTPVTCTAPDACHGTGACDPVAGCPTPILPDGTACNDGNLCTLTDTCQLGVCTGADPTVCVPSDGCHDAGMCDPASGVCSNPVKADGSTCSDGNACTTGDACKSGMCVPGEPVSCAPLDDCHVAGTCDAATGSCSNPDASDGTKCGGTGTCTGGVCHGGMSSSSSSSSSSGTGSGAGSSSSGGAGGESASSSSSSGGQESSSGGVTGGTGSTSSGGKAVNRPGGCGCGVAASPAAGGLWVGLGLLFAARRRRAMAV